MDTLPVRTIQDFIQDHIEETRDVYIRSPKRMFSEFKGEKENVRNYNGRQLLEMLQNADDAASEALGEKKILIKLSENKLIIANTGYPFSENGLSSIFLSHLSPKEAMANQIGKKGLGFRSILSWSRQVTIKSKELLVTFSEEYSQKFLNDLLLNDGFKSAYLQLNKGHKTPIATLICPNIESANAINFPNVEEFDTVIEIELYDKSVNEVKKQIEQDLDAEVLLFLNHLENIEIDIDGEISGYIKSKVSETEIQIVCNSKCYNSTKIWNINSLEGRFVDLDKPYHLSLAWQRELQDCKDVVYSYFRTKVPIKLSGILNGSFELNADRNLIIKDEDGYNQKLLELLPSLIANTSQIIATQQQEANYKALKFIHVDFSFLKNLIDPELLRRKLINEVTTKRIFPNILGNYIDFSEENKPVYYKEEELAKFLTPHRFPLLLIKCHDLDDEEFILSLKPRHYKCESIIDDISKQRKKISVTDYAKLIVIIHDKISSADLVSKYLFYDKGHSLLSFDTPIFYPPNGSKYVLPIELGVQVIDSTLSQELLGVTNNRAFSELVRILPKYEIKEYRFEEVVEILISHYASKKITTEKILELNNYLFKLFCKEKNPGQRWIGSNVMLVSKNNAKGEANSLYLGKDYGCSLTEEIYSYNKKKLVAAPKKFGIDESQENSWTTYLKWLGVADSPRLINAKGEEEFANWVMLSYNYKNPIEDLYFKNGFVDFKRDLNYFGQILVKTIDDIDAILVNNENAKIFELISSRNEVLEALEKDIEPPTSYIKFWFYNRKSVRAISGGKMKNYLKWKIQKLAWLCTESGVKTPPEKCSTAAYITEDFQKLVERPKIDFELMKKRGINRDKVEFLLSVFGVHKSINTFPTNMLYSILLKLEEIDQAGKKAKTIYNQLAANFDEKLLDKQDKADRNYIEFHSKAKVYCTNGKYEFAKEVFYVNDRRYGVTIIKQFKTIEIDRRRGKDKIRKLFGVKPLEKIDLNLIDKPLFHSLNSLFEFEMEIFKPYVYVLRREVDNGTEKNIIKETKFQLVDELRLQLTKGEKDVSINLNEYEYFYSRSRNTAYLKAPGNFAENKNLKIEDLKDDIHFCSAIAEVFSAILDVETQRQQIRELFSKSTMSRDELIRTEIDDENLQKLNTAREILGITNNPKFEFWKSFIKCKKHKQFSINNFSDAELLNALCNNFPKYQENITKVFDEINYQDFNEEISAELIVQLFKDASITIEVFNEFHYPSFDTSLLYEITFKRILDAHLSRFKSQLYKRCTAHDILKLTFLEKINRYQLLQPVAVNVVDFDVFEDLNRQVASNFGVDIFLDEALLDLQEIYQRSVERLWINSQSLIAERKLFEQFINEDIKVQSLLYFGDTTSKLIELLQLWLGKNKNQTGTSTAESKGKRISFGTKTVLFNNLADLKDQMDSFIKAEEIKLTPCNNIKTTRKENNKESGTGNGTQKGNFKTPKVPQEEIGFLGEYLVYRFLLETIDLKINVKWVSKFAKDSGVNLDGKDGLGYDIEYVPNGAKYPRYVEVKVVGWQDSFHISSNEVQYGEKYGKNYEVFLVRNLDNPTNLKIEKIQGLFDYRGQSFNSNDLFTVINDNYIIRFNKVL